MKKSAFLLVLVLMIIFSNVSVAETTVTHYIPELEVSVDIPFSISCVSRESDETNAFFQGEHFDYATTHQYMLDNQFYLYGMTLDGLGEFALAAGDYDEADFNSLDNFSLSLLSNQLKSAYATKGAVDIQNDVYQGKKDKAIRIHYRYNTQQGDQYVLYYFTTRASKLLSIRFISFFTKISDEQEKMIQNIFESLDWGKKAFSTDPKGQTDINIYTDYETGLTFMVPSGWSEVKFVAGEDSKKVKYRINMDDVWVLYESGDMWDTLNKNFGDLINTYGITRKDIGNDYLSREMVATQLGCSVSDVSMKTIGSQEYYCLNKSNSYSTGSVTLDTQDIVYICMRNAYMYWFQLSGVNITKYEDQFNRFMRTVEFP